MAHSGELKVIYNFDDGYGRQFGHVKLQDWHTKLGYHLRKLIWKESQHLFSNCGLLEPIYLWLWKDDGQLIDLEKKLVGDIFEVEATSKEVFVTSMGAKRHDAPLRSTGGAGTIAGTAESDARTASRSVVSIAASNMNSACYDTLVRAAHVEFCGTYATQHDFDHLMEASAVCSGSWVNVPEPFQLQAVLSEVKGWVDIPAYLSLGDCSREPATVWWGKDVHVNLTSANDILLYYRSYDLPHLGGILGIKVKKNMQRRDMDEAVAEFLCWGGRSYFPFVQLLTDMVSGGVFIFAAEKDGEVLKIQRACYVNMEGVKDFVRRLVGDLSPNLDNLDMIDTFYPDKLHVPERIKISDLKSASPWPLVWDCRSDDDVANLSDLEGFDFGALPMDMDGHGSLGALLKVAHGVLAGKVLVIGFNTDGGS